MILELINEKILYNARLDAVIHPARTPESD